MPQAVGAARSLDGARRPSARRQLPVEPVEFEEGIPRTAGATAILSSVFIAYLPSCSDSPKGAYIAFTHCSPFAMTISALNHCGGAL